VPKKEILEVGKTVDAAIDSACEKLGCNREDCEWEIIDLPKKGFLGLKNTPAKVRVSIEIPEEKKEPEPAKAAPAKAYAPKNTPSPRPAPVQKTAPAAKTVQNARADKPASGMVSQEKIALAKNYLKEMLDQINLEAEITVTEEDSGICMNIEGKGLGIIIGRRGETLDAIQYLTSLVANRIDGDYMRVTIDCGDHRVKRKETLETLASRLASQVLKTNVSRTLEPMNPFERRIIHAAISEIEGVSSISIGEEPNRRIVITSPTASRARNNRNSSSRNGGRPPRRDFDNKGGQGGGRSPRPSGNRDGARRPSPRPAPSQQKSNEPPKKTLESTVSNDKPLYTKIDLD